MWYTSVNMTAEFKEWGSNHWNRTTDTNAVFNKRLSNHNTQRERTWSLYKSQTFLPLSCRRATNLKYISAGMLSLGHKPIE